MMDHMERGVLRRKSLLLRTMMSGTQGVLDECQRQGLVSDADVAQIKVRGNTCEDTGLVCSLLLNAKLVYKVD